MISVARSPTPAILTQKGTAARQSLCTLYEATPDHYRTGAGEFPFKASLYAAPEVRDALRQSQHRKCAFCESFFDHTGYGDVEHFRPKAGYRQRRGDPLRRPGYYWLVYEWENLFFSCQLCNQQFKENLFPLRDGRRRARSHHHDIGKEAPLLIDPASPHPTAYLGFRGEYAVPVNGCLEGATTIEVLGLNRAALVDARRRHVRGLDRLLRVCALLREKLAANPHDFVSARELQEYENLLADSREPTSEFTAMTRAYLDSLAPA